MAKYLKLLSINCRGLKKRKKRRAIFKTFRDHKFDIVCIQEAHTTEKDVNIWKRELTGNVLSLWY